MAPAGKTDVNQVDNRIQCAFAPGDVDALGFDSSRMLRHAAAQAAFCVKRQGCALRQFSSINSFGSNLPGVLGATTSMFLLCLFLVG